MLDRFSRYIIDHALVKGKRPVLAAVSGGIDSVVLVRLLKLAGIPFAIAHCNFGLRGRESDGDEKFVRALAAAEKVPFHTVKFDTETFAGDNKLGIQAAARKLRYDWFRKLVKENGYQSVATAHHADDLAETILLNLIRGSALAGSNACYGSPKMLMGALMKNRLRIFLLYRCLPVKTDNIMQPFSLRNQLT